MYEFLFYLFSITTLLGGLMVVLARNPVNGAMFMIVSLVGLACLFGQLQAYFLAILQILVYAGAVMVLFLFIIMLLNVQSSTKVKFDATSVVAALISLAFLVGGIVYMFVTSNELPFFPEPFVSAEVTSAMPLDFTTSVKSFGYGLFTKYMLPLQVAGFLLLVAMVGVIVISKRFEVSNKEEVK